MTKTDILVIGGGPAGVIAAITARKKYPSKKIILIKKGRKGIIPCGIPYIFRRLDSVDKDVMSDKPLLDNNIEIVIEEAKKIEPKQKKAILKNGVEYSYEKLILATGSYPHLIPIAGVEKEGVWLVKKDCQYLKDLRQAVLRAKNVVIIGGGFIGVELAEELSRLKDLKISIVEMLEHCLAINFSQEFAMAAEKKIENRGVKIYAGKTVKEIGGDNKVEYVELDDGEKIPAELVILSIGAKPNINLAEEAGVKVEKKGAIQVDEYQITSLSDIFAVGDCAQTKDFITGKNIPIMLASVASYEARIAANNLYEIKSNIQNKGTVGAFSTFIDGLALAAFGLNEKRAKEEGIDYFIGEAEAPNHHPAALSGTEKIKVKLIFAKPSGLLLGGEIMGPESVGEIINLLALAVQRKVSIYDLEILQIATHPLLTSAPTVYPIIIAAQNAMMKLK